MNELSMTSAIIMRTATFYTALIMMMATWSCEQQLQREDKQQQQHREYHNLPIMQNVIDSDMPLPLQNAIAACSSIIREYFVPNANSFMLSMNVGETHLKWHMRDFLNNLLLNLSEIKVQIENMNGVRQRSLNRKYNLIVVDGMEALSQLDPAKLTSDYDIQEYYLLYFMHASRFKDIEDVIHKMFSYFWKNSIINVSLIKVKNSSMEAFTYYPFDNSLSCKLPVVKKKNYYSGFWLQPIGSSIFPQKLYNLQRCPLGVAVWNTPPYFSYLKNAKGFYDIGYFEAALLYVLAEKLNFSLDLQEPPNNEQRGRVLANGSITGAMKMLNDRIADLSLGSFRYTLERAEVLTAALPYYQTWQIYGILRNGQLYSSLEILMYAFDVNTWLCLFFSMQIAFIVALLIYFYYDHSVFVRYCMGFPCMQTPLMNIIGIFLGQSVIQPPKTNFLKCMLIFWLIYGLLMRTAYQSLLFQMLKQNLYHQQPQTLSDLIDQKYTLVMTETTYDSISTVTRIEQGLIDVIKLKNTSEESTFFYMENDMHRHRLASISPKDFLTYHVIKEQKRGIFYMLPEKVFTQHITMYFTKHSYLINRFNELFMNLRSMGLIDFWANESLDIRFFYNDRKQIFTPISFDNINGVFIIYLVLIYMAIVTFCLELLYCKIRKYLLVTKYDFVN